MKNLYKVFVLSFCLLFFFQIGVVFADDPQIIPTFHSMSLYWTPVGAGSGRDTVAHVMYREEGGQWQNGLDMKYNFIGNNESKGQFRGSVVNLKPNTEYTFKLTMSNTTATVSGTTWGIPLEGSVHEYPNGLVGVGLDEGMLIINDGGTVNGYAVYDGKNSVTDFGNTKNTAIIINASYVIVRNFTIKNTGKPGLSEEDGPPVGVIQIADGVHDVVIEGCDISYFGRQGRGPDPDHVWDGQQTHGHNQDSGILFSRGANKNIHHIVIQRNRIHHPNYDCNSWHDVGDDGDDGHHADGPQGISMWNTKGQIVIRYNEFYSDMNHMFNDIIGGGENEGFIGSPGPDSDIYCNYLSHTWDDAIEVEGGGQNVRVWNNYITEAALGISNASVRIGPLYVWRNVIDKSFWWNENVYSDELNNYDGDPFWPRGTFMKMGNTATDGVAEQTGHMYIFNNTIYQDYNNYGCAVGIGGSSETFSGRFEPYDPGRVVRHCTSRNNILQVLDANAVSISYNSSNIDNDFDYDLFDGKVSGEPNGVKVKVNAADNNDYEILTYAGGVGITGLPDGDPLHGNFQLANNSAGYNQGAIINNFADAPVYGDNCDIGADDHNGNINLQYGTGADFYPPESRDVSNGLIENGDFADGSDGWELDDEATNPENNFVHSMVDYDNGEAKITIKHEFDFDWELELHHPITGGIEAGKDYVVEFKAKTGGSTRNMSCLIREWHDNYDATYLGTTVSLNGTYKTYKIAFHADAAITQQCDFTFGLSGMLANTIIYIDDVHMNEITTGDELLINNYFDENLSNWEIADDAYAEVETDIELPFTGNSAKITVLQRANNNYTSELFQSVANKVKANKDYIIQFRAKADRETNMHFVLREWGGNYDPIDGSTLIALSEKERTYSLILHPTSNNYVALCHFEFELGGVSAGTEIWVDDVHLLEITDGLGKTQETISKEKVALEYSLSNNYPNPFNPTTIIKFSIKKAGNTTLDVYNILGQKVKTLLNKDLTPGTYTANFNGSNLTSGIYFYVLQSNNFREVKKMMLIK